MCTAVSLVKRIGVYIPSQESISSPGRAMVACIMLRPSLPDDGPMCHTHHTLSHVGYHPIKIDCLCSEQSPVLHKIDTRMLYVFIYVGVEDKKDRW